MSKTFLYCLLVIMVYVFIIYPMNRNEDTEEITVKEEEVKDTSSSKTELHETNNGLKGNKDFSAGYTA